VCVGQKQAFIRLERTFTSALIGTETMVPLKSVGEWPLACQAAALCLEKGWEVGDWIGFEVGYVTQIHEIRHDGIVMSGPHGEESAAWLNTNCFKQDPPALKEAGPIERRVERLERFVALYTKHAVPDASGRILPTSREVRKELHEIANACSLGSASNHARESR
jgi:hypothetical protein